MFGEGEVVPIGLATPVAPGGRLTLRLTDEHQQIPGLAQLGQVALHGAAVAADQRGEAALRGKHRPGAVVAVLQQRLMWRWPLARSSDPHGPGSGTYADGSGP